MVSLNSEVEENFAKGFWRGGEALVCSTNVWLRTLRLGQKENSCRGIRAVPYAMQLCPSWVSLEINILWACPRPKTGRAQEPHPIQEYCLGQRSESKRSLRKNNDYKCLYINLEFISQDPFAVVSLSCLMCSMAMLGGEGKFYVIDEDIDIQPVCSRTREGTLPDTNEKVGAFYLFNYAFYLS